MYKLDGTGLIKRIISNHVHAPEYQSANIIPRQFRRSKLDSIKGLVSDEFYNDIHGRYYNAEDNGYSDYFIKSTETLDKFRKESWKDTFEKLYTSLQKSPI
jgi:hypothetical protein